MRPALRAVIVASAALLVASTSSEARGAYSVFAATPRYVRTSLDIAAVCGEATLGCTDLTAAALRTHCERRGEEWSPSAEIRFAPVVHLPAFAGPGPARRLLEHELSHLRDVHRAAEAHARALSARRFASAEACRDAALAEEEAFGGWMREAARQSVALRR